MKQRISLTISFLILTTFMILVNSREVYATSECFSYKGPGQDFSDRTTIDVRDLNPGDYLSPGTVVTIDYNAHVQIQYCKSDVEEFQFVEAAILLRKDTFTLPDNASFPYYQVYRIIMNDGVCEDIIFTQAYPLRLISLDHGYKSYRDQIRGTSYDSSGIEDGHWLYEKTFRPEDPLDENYNFVGWYTERECINEFEFGKRLTGYTYAYAKWEEKPKQSDNKTENDSIDKKTHSKATKTHERLMEDKKYESTESTLPSWTVKGTNGKILYDYKALDSSLQSINNQTVFADFCTKKAGLKSTILITKDIYAPIGYGKILNTKSISWRNTGAKFGDIIYVVWYSQELHDMQFLPAVVSLDGTVIFTLPQAVDVSTISIVKITK